ncbi:hypothetical protein N9Y48_04460 [Zobellia sp.]|nr:hypothetical protein [Zobellia sp.]
MNNEIIRQNLVKKRNKHIATLESIFNLDSLFKNVLQNLKGFDFQVYKQNLEMEVRKNVKEWWTNPEKGIKKEEELYAILFEYGYFFQKKVEATAYGIGEWKDFQVQYDKFNMGFDYDFTTEFYALPGIELRFFESLKSLNHENLPKEYTNDHINYDELKDGDIINMDEFNDIELIDGFNDLIELHKLEGMITIHDVLLKIDSYGGFELLNYKDNFMFVIEEHDSGEVYPLLVKKK